MGEVVVRRSPPVDDVQLSRLHAAAFGEAGYPRPWARQLAAHSLGWVCAFDDDVLVGFVNLAWDGDLHAFLIDTAVAPRSQRRGVGALLVREAVALAREAGCEWVHVDFARELSPFYLDACGMTASSAATLKVGALRSTTPGVVRIGATVRRPYGPWVPSVRAVLAHLEAHDFPAPRPLGTDEHGREMLTWVPGIPGWLEHARWWEPADMIAAAGRLLRQLHDVLDTFAPPAGAVWRGGWDRSADGRGPVCHHDFAPWNVVVGPDRSLSVIDWDGCGPGERMAELAYAIIGFVPLRRDAACRELGWVDAPVRVERIELFRRAYGLPDSQRDELADAIVASARSGVVFSEQMHAERREPWASWWAADGGAGDREDLALTEDVVAAWNVDAP